MTQDEKWLAKYKEVIDFIETNQRNPSKYRKIEGMLPKLMKMVEGEMRSMR